MRRLRNRVKKSPAALAINSSRTIVGNYSVPVTNEFRRIVFPLRGFVLEQGEYVTIEPPPWPESIVLYDDDAFGHSEARFLPNYTGDLAPRSGTSVVAINDLGQILITTSGTYIDADFYPYQFDRSFIGTPVRCRR